jgi:hypothetical protein
VDVVSLLSAIAISLLVLDLNEVVKGGSSSSRPFHVISSDACNLMQKGTVKRHSDVSDF